MSCGVCQHAVGPTGCLSVVADLSHDLLTYAGGRRIRGVCEGAVQAPVDRSSLAHPWAGVCP